MYVFLMRLGLRLRSKGGARKIKAHVRHLFYFTFVVYRSTSESSSVILVNFRMGIPLIVRSVFW